MAGRNVAYAALNDSYEKRRFNLAIETIAEPVGQVGVHCGAEPETTCRSTFVDCSCRAHGLLRGKIRGQNRASETKSGSPQKEGLNGLVQLEEGTETRSRDLDQRSFLIVTWRPTTSVLSAPKFRSAVSHFCSSRETGQEKQIAAIWFYER